MRSRSFHSVMALVTFIPALIGLVSGCVNNPNSSGEIDTATSETSIIISGRTVTVDGAVLTETWIAVADDATQQIVSETSSDETGAFTITLDDASGDYTMLASYQEDDGTVLIAWQGFNISDLAQDYEFDLVMTEAPVVDEGTDSAAVPPPGGCYRVYFGSTWCSNHILYSYYELSGAWYCSLVGARVGAVGCC